MPAEVHVSGVGLLAAAVILVGVVSVLWWMLHPATHAHGAFAADAETANVVLVPVTPNTPPELLHLAAVLANETMATVMLLHVVEVPFTLPLDAHGVGGNGRTFLREFRKAVEAEGASVECKVARSRRAGKTIVDWARALRPKAVVLGALAHRGSLGSTTTYVLENADPFRVLIYKP
jgi:nucleotide-binding universal stress UspA family protein